MSEIQKGDYVLTVGEGRGRLVRDSHRWATYSKGEELIVTSINASGLSVKKVSGGAVFRISRAFVVKPIRKLGEVPEGGIEVDDPRIAWIWEDAGRLADRLGYCRVYDRMVEQLGAPGRERTFTIKLSVSEGVEVTAKVEARSRKLAEARVRAQFAAGATSIVREITT